MSEARVPVNIAILTVSDTRDESTDKSGKLLVERLTEAGHNLHEKCIRPDDIYQLRAQVSQWIADDKVQAVVTTGGTGLTGRDGTPEALSVLFDKQIEGFDDQALELLTSYDWPGNVRQLENILMKAVVIAQGDSLNIKFLPEEIVSGKKLTPPSEGKTSGMSLKELERDHIRSVLVATGWHKGKACKILGISRPRLERRIGEFGFVREE